MFKDHAYEVIVKVKLCYAVVLSFLTYQSWTPAGFLCPNPARIRHPLSEPNERIKSPISARNNVTKTQCSLVRPTLLLCHYCKIKNNPNECLLQTTDSDKNTAKIIR